MKALLLALPIAMLLPGCASQQSSAGKTRSGLDPKNFETTIDGKSTRLITLTNESGMEVCITNYGGRIVSITVPDREGQFRDVVLGFDSISDYLPEHHLTDFGASIGRYANRIAHCKFTLDGKEYQLPENNFGHTLHGGPRGWQYKVYDIAQSNDSTVLLSLTSPDGDNGFPGEVKASVRYTLSKENALVIHYEGVSSAPTVINMTNHSYFNLGGDMSKPIVESMLTVDSEGITEVDSTFMTTGEILTVEGTPFDFREARPIAEGIDADHSQIRHGKGYDHNFVLSHPGDLDSPAAILYSPASGITLTTYTTEPGLQVYTGNFLDGTVIGKHGVAYGHRSGICLETQKYPDTPNKPQWPSAVLRPGEKYSSTTIYKFTVD